MQTNKLLLPFAVLKEIEGLLCAGFSTMTHVHSGTLQMRATPLEQAPTSKGLGGAKASAVTVVTVVTVVTLESAPLACFMQWCNGMHSFWSARSTTVASSNHIGC